MKLIFSDDAEHGLDGIAAWIARDNPRRAVSYIREIRAACASLCAFPERFPWADESRGIRKRTYGNYLILYKVENDVVRITAVEHGSRDLSHLI